VQRGTPFLANEMNDKIPEPRRWLVQAFTWWGRDELGKRLKSGGGGVCWDRGVWKPLFVRRNPGVVPTGRNPAICGLEPKPSGEVVEGTCRDCPERAATCGVVVVDGPAGCPAPTSELARTDYGK
jgi:hypothetical protein